MRFNWSLQDRLYPREGLGLGSPETSASRRVWLLLATGLEAPAARSQWAFRTLALMALGHGLGRLRSEGLVIMGLGAGERN